MFCLLLFLTGNSMLVLHLEKKKLEGHENGHAVLLLGLVMQEKLKTSEQN